MANQLCRSAETNHRIAESITVSHGNTLPQLSVFMKLGWSQLSLQGWWGGDNRGMFGMHSCELAKVAHVGCNLDSDKEGDREVLSSAPLPQVKSSSTKVKMDDDLRLTSKTQQRSLSGRGRKGIRSSRTLITHTRYLPTLCTI